jgi:hypothetical protein
MNRKPSRRWRKVGTPELQILWAELRKQNICYNGCTHVALAMKYGPANLKHIMGRGWYKLTATP